MIENFESRRNLEGSPETLSAGRTQVHQGTRELLNLLNDDDYRANYLGAASKAQSKQLNEYEKKISGKIRRNYIQPAVNEKALAALVAEGKIDEGSNVKAAQKLGREWGEALANVRSITITLNGENVKVDPRSFAEHEDDLREQLLKDNPDLQQEVDAAIGALETARENAQSELEKLKRDLTDRLNDTELQEAMTVWGQAPNLAKSRGQYGKGFHAGVVHYFEYRASNAESGRYRDGEGYDFSLDHFIDFSKRLKDLVNNPGTYAGTESYAIFEDDKGAQRLML